MMANNKKINCIIYEHVRVERIIMGALVTYLLMMDTFVWINVKTSVREFGFEHQHPNRCIR